MLEQKGGLGHSFGSKNSKERDRLEVRVAETVLPGSAYHHPEWASPNQDTTMCIYPAEVAVLSH